MLNIGVTTPGSVCVSVYAQNEYRTSMGKTYISDKLHAYADKSSGKSVFSSNPEATCREAEAKAEGSRSRGRCTKEGKEIQKCVTGNLEGGNLFLQMHMNKPY